MHWRTNAGGLSHRALWASREDGAIFLDEADGVSQLRAALPAPQLHWISDGGRWAISITCAYTLWLDMINVPAIKDAGWDPDGYAFDQKLIDPTQVFARCWPHVLEVMTSEDWLSVTTPGAFSKMVRTIVSTRVASSKKSDFDLRSTDLVDLPAFNLMGDLNWTQDDCDLFQWIRGLRYDRNALADRDGHFGLLKLLEYFVGVRFTQGQMMVNSHFHSALDLLTTFAVTK